MDLQNRGLGMDAAQASGPAAAIIRSPCNYLIYMQMDSIFRRPFLPVS